MSTQKSYIDSVGGVPRFDPMDVESLSKAAVFLKKRTCLLYTSTVSGDVYIGSGETEAIRQLAEIAKVLHDDYPGIRYHIYSGNAQDVTERLDKGLLDFGLLIQPADLSKYNSFNLPDRDTWGVIMRKDSPLAQMCIRDRRLPI